MEINYPRVHTHIHTLAHTTFPMAGLWPEFKSPWLPPGPSGPQVGRYGEEVQTGRALLRSKAGGQQGGRPVNPILPEPTMAKSPSDPQVPLLKKMEPITPTSQGPSAWHTVGTHQASPSHQCPPLISQVQGRLKAAFISCPAGTGDPIRQ